MAANDGVTGRANYIKALEAMLYTAKQLEPYTRSGLKFVHDDITKSLAGQGLPTCNIQCSRHYGADPSR